MRTAKDHMVHHMYKVTSYDKTYYYVHWDGRKGEGYSPADAMRAALGYEDFLYELPWPGQLVDPEWKGNVTVVEGVDGVFYGTLSF